MDRSNLKRLISLRSLLFTTLVVLGFTAVGAATHIPQSLIVGATSGSSSVIESPNGTVGAPAFTFQADTTSGLYRVGTGETAISIGGAQALDFKKSSGGFGNVGMGGSASTSDLFPLLLQRDQAGSFVSVQISNPDSVGGSGARYQAAVDAGNDVAEFTATSVNSVAPDAYSGGRAVLRATGSLAGVSIIGDSSSGSDIKFFAGGDADTNRVVTMNSSGLTAGITGTLTGKVNLAGITSGLVTIQPQAAAGTYNFNLPITAGSSGQPLLSAAGGSSPMTFGTLGVAAGGTGLVSGTSGGILGFTGSTTLASSGALTANQLIIGGGAGATPSSLAAGSQYQVLTMGASNPGYGAVSLNQSAAVSGTLAVANGGTGQNSFTDGQLLIGNTTGNTLTPATLSAGTNITITNGHGSISIAASSSASPAYNYTSQTTTYSAAISDWIVASGASFTITLPTAVGQAGKSIVIQHSGTSLSQVYTLNSTLSQTIGGIAGGSYALYTNGEVLIVISDGANWQVLSHKTAVSRNSAGSTVFSATSAYVFTVTSANATVGAVYSNNGQTFIVSTTIAAGVTLNASGTGTPAASGTLTKVSGTGDATITFSSKTITGVPVKGSTTVDAVSWERFGDRAEITVSYVQSGTGISGSGDYIFQMPSNMTIDLSGGAITAFQTIIGNATQSKQTNSVGYGWVSGSTDSGAAVVSVYDSTHFRLFMIMTADSGAICSASNTGVGASNVTWNVTFRVPILGWQP